MCEAWPGPRCNDRCKDRDARYATFKSVSKNASPDNVDYKVALHSLVASQKIYDTTPKGIEELRKEFINGDDSSTNIMNGSRLIYAESTRKMQIEALKEITSGRFDAFATIISDINDGYDKEELSSIISASRINRENFINSEAEVAFRKNGNYNISEIDNLIKESETRSGEDYYSFVDLIKANTKKIYSDYIPEEISTAIEKLDNLEPPSAINLHAYRSIGNAVKKSQEQTAAELKRISAIQDAPAEVVAEYFDAYRKQYKDEYSVMPSNKQPNPPKAWVEGYLPNNGLSKNLDTFFIPKDPATVYAIYRMRTDLNAIPDYLKKSSKYVAVDKNQDGTYSITETTKTGKQLKQKKCASDELAPLVKSSMKDSIFIFKDIKEFSNREIDLSANVIALNEVMQKHFDYPAINKAQMAQAFSTNESGLNIYSAMRKRILKTWNTKSARNNLPSLDFKPTGTARLIQFVR